MQGGAPWRCACGFNNPGTVMNCMGCRAPRGMPPHSGMGQMYPPQRQGPPRQQQGQAPYSGPSPGTARSPFHPPTMHARGGYRPPPPAQPPARAPGTNHRPGSTTAPPTPARPPAPPAAVQPLLPTPPPPLPPPPSTPSTSLLPSPSSVNLPPVQPPPVGQQYQNGTINLPWDCPTCTFKNTVGVSSTHCSRCGSRRVTASATDPATSPQPRPPPPVAIPPALTANTSNNTLAVATTVTSPASAVPPSQQMWPCTYCGNKNYAFRPQCNKCDRARVTTSKVKAMMAGDWICNTCDEHNYSWNDKCTKCKKGKSESFAAEPELELKGAAVVPEDCTFLLERFAVGAFTHVRI